MKNAIILHGLPSKKEAERFAIGSDRILVGHSMGAGFWARYLTERPDVSVNKVILVAPWLNVAHQEASDFF